MFRLVDQDSNGFVDVQELMLALRILGENPTDSEVEAMIKAFDIDGDGHLSLTEFHAFINTTFPTKLDPASTPSRRHSTSSHGT